MQNIARYDRGMVKGDAKISDEGYIRANAIVTRTGVFIYKNPDGTIRRELRHPDDVLRPDSLDTMKMIPVTNGHPQERLVNSENAKKLAIGYTGETIEHDGNHIMSRIVITDIASVKDVTEKNRKELSLGYTVDLVPEIGIYNGEPYDFRQSNIKYNHLSIVDVARAGSAARIALDGDDAIEVLKEELKDMAKVSLKIDNEEIMVEPKTAAHYEKLMSDFKNLTAEKERVERELAMIQKELEKAEGERDSLQEKVTNLPEEDKPGAAPEEETGMKADGRLFKAKVRERVKLEKLASTVLDSNIDIDSLSNFELKKKMILAKSKNMNLDGKSEIYIDAAFDIAIQETKSTVKATPSGKTQHGDTSEMPSADEARKKMIERLQNPKKGDN